MVKCSFQNCDEILNYLPFKCRYCGGTYCKAHRLPENHDCTFSMSDNPRSQSSTVSSSTSIPEEPYNSAQSDFNSTSYNSTDDYDKQMEREMRDYIRTQERQAMPPPPSRSSRVQSENYRPFISRTNKMQATLILMGTTFVFFLLSLIPGVPDFLLLNMYNVYSRFMIQTLFTSMITPGAGLASIFTLLFAELMLYSMGKSIEMQFGSKFMVTIYAICGGAGVLTIVLIQSLGMISLFSFLSDGLLVSAQWCAILGMMTFLLHLVGLDREMRMYLYFIPIRLKAKYILYFLIGYSSVFAIIGLFSGYSTALYLGQLMGILAGKKMFDKYGRRVVTGIY